MKLVFDQNLSYELARSLHQQYPDSKHVKDCGLTGHDDADIWKLAFDQHFTIVSKDADFLHRSLLRGHPPQVLQ